MKALNGGRLRVAVIMGGMSSEREVSLRTGAKVLEALDPARYEAFPIDPRPRTESTAWLDLLAREAIDVAFLALHGRYGEDGTIQGLLELLSIPYTGSGVLSSALAIDKAKTKQIYQQSGIPTPEARVALAAEDREKLAEELPFPAVIKPNREGSTIGISIVRSREEMRPALDLAFRFDPRVLVERFVTGVEITAAVIGNEEPRALPLIEIVPRSGFYDYEMKYTPGATEEICPARLSPEATARAEDLARRAHQALGCRGTSRTDMIVGEDGIWVLETNTIPGMTETSLLPRAAATAGIAFPALVEKLIDLALQ